MTPLDVLRQHWGHPEFRPMQADIIDSVLAGRDTLALLPTGGGKSICFQVPALCRDGMCLVVSPLIALMKDQVQNLEKRGIAAAAIYSGMNARAVDIAFENACQGAYKFLYISPERLRTDLALARLQRMNINLLAIDEAHCISQWGYDFRPPYLQIADIRPLLPNVPVLALTATATAQVVKDIQERLAFKEKNVFQQSFQRPNLSYSVLYETQKKAKLLDILRRVPGTSVVYTRSRGETKLIANYLITNGLNADFYHAGLSTDERSAKQEAWHSGRTRIVVCTNAFGMGIDKPDVRCVVHLSLPDSLEAYFQEAGRGGRDGQKSFAVLLYEPNDAGSLRSFFEIAYPPFEVVRRVYQALGSYTQIAIGGGVGESFPFDLQQFCHAFKLEQPVAHAALRLLEQEGWVALSDLGGAPARLHIHTTREVLYDYQLRHKVADLVSKSALRLYQRVQHEFVDISESLLAKMAKLPTEQIEQALKTGDTEGIWMYQPRSDKPNLTFTRERVAAENLTIDHEKFQFRRDNAERRIEQAIAYAEQRRCRSQQLLAYFGEKNAPKCGICDVCTGRNQADTSTDTHDNYSRKIRSILPPAGLTFDEILEAFPMKRHEIVRTTLGYLLEEGILVEDELGKIRAG
jgi:ATP-dependent DNA helicase RecQ